MRDRIAGLLHLDLRGRVMLATGLVLAAGLTLLTLGVMVYLRDQLRSDASSILAARAEAQVAMVSSQGGKVKLRRVAGGEEESWIFADGRALRRGAGPPSAQAEADALATARKPVEITLGESMKLRAEPVFDGPEGRQVATVVAGISLEPYEHTRNIFFVAMVVFDAVILAIGVLLSRRAVGRALAPVDEMTRQASEWSERDLDQRFARGPVRDELTALSATLDDLLARIASGLRREQRLSAEMAHELRTPLAGVRAEAELALRDPDLSPPSESLDRIVDGAKRMEKVIDTLLLTARDEMNGRSGACVALDAVREAIASMQAKADAAGVSLRIDAEALEAAADLSIDADQALVVHALNPLLDNAVRHARREVSAGLSESGGVVEIVVFDDGPGFVDAEQSFEPEAAHLEGFGLGLPLAQRLARSGGGEVTVDQGGEPGGKVRLRLPARRNRGARSGA